MFMFLFLFYFADIDFQSQKWMQTLFLISGDSMLKTCPYRLLNTSRNTGHFLLLSITKHASWADGQVNKNGTLEMRNSLTKSAFLGEYTMILFALIRNYWEKDKRSIVVSRQLTHLPKCVSSHYLPSNFSQCPSRKLHSVWSSPLDCVFVLSVL